MSTIHGNSSDPVLIKKIYLRTWLLRDEIEEVIRKRLEAGQKLSDINIEKLRQEYHFKGALQVEKAVDEKPKEGLKIVEDEPENEDAEAAAPSETQEENPEEVQAATEESPAENQVTEDAQTAEANATTDESAPTLTVAPMPETGVASDPTAIAGAATIDGQAVVNTTADAPNPAVAASINPETPNALASTPVSEPTVAAPLEPVYTYVESNVLEPVTKDNNLLVINQRHPQLPTSRVFKGTTLLSEISIDNILFFSSKPFLDGQSIVIEFLVPKRFVLNADIVYCRPFNHKSRIISEEKLSYRVSARFTFLKPGERTIIRHFLQAIEPEVAVTTKVPKKQAASDDDDLDALEGLDL